MSTHTHSHTHTDDSRFFPVFLQHLVRSTALWHLNPGQVWAVTDVGLTFEFMLRITWSIHHRPAADPSQSILITPACCSESLIVCQHQWALKWIQAPAAAAAAAAEHPSVHGSVKCMSIAQRGNSATHMWFQSVSFLTERRPHSFIWLQIQHLNPQQELLSKLL